MKPEILLDCPDLLRDFLFYMETVKGRSPRTVEGYYTDLRTFLRYIKATKQLQMTTLSPSELSKLTIGDISSELICSVTLSDVYAYLSYALSERDNHAAARARKASSIRSLYNYLTTKVHLLEVSPVKDLDLPSTKQALPKFLSLEESLELLQAVSAAENPRDYCMITLMINCGMRVSELVGINVGDIRKEEKTLRLLGKGNKERIIYLNTACLEAISEYEPIRAQLLANAKQRDTQVFFLSNRYGRLTTRRVEQILEKYLAAAGLSGRGYSPHKLRHTAATLMYQHGGVDVRVLKEILGHESLATTEIYTHVSNRQMEQASDSSPLASIKPKKAASAKQTADTASQDTVPTPETTQSSDAEDIASRIEKPHPHHL